MSATQRTQAPQPVSTSSRGVRTLRAVIASSLAVFVALAFHVIGGGSAPSPILLIAAVILALPICILLIGRGLSSLRLSAVVIAAQGVLHALFGLGLTGSMTSGGHAAHISGHLAAADAAAGISGGAQSTPMAPGAGFMAGGMSAAHLAAACITVLALRFGEGALRQLLQVAEWHVRRLVRALHPPAHDLAGREIFAARAAKAGRASLSAQLLAWSAQRHRGPPLAA